MIDADDLIERARSALAQHCRNRLAELRYKQGELKWWNFIKRWEVRVRMDAVESNLSLYETMPKLTRKVDSHE